MVIFESHSSKQKIISHNIPWQGINSTFKLELEDDPHGIFEVVPHHVIREAEFVLVVRDTSKLRFEPQKDPRLTMKVSTAPADNRIAQRDGSLG